MNKVEESYRSRYDYFYFLMATDNLVEFQSLANNSLDKEDLFKMETLKSPELTIEECKALKGEELFLKMSHVTFKCRMLSVQTIINSVLCLESLINDYAVTKFSQSYFDEHFKRLSIASKYIIVPQLALSKSFDKSQQPYKNLKDLIKVRNNLVHSKSKSFNNSQSISEAQIDTIVHVSRTHKHYETIKLILTEFISLDPEYEYFNIYKMFFKGESETNNMDHFWSSLIAR